MIRTIALLASALVFWSMTGETVPQRGAPALVNAVMRAEFGPRGLAALRDVELDHVFRITGDEFSITLSGQTFDSAKLAPPKRTATPDRVTYAWTAGPHVLNVTYELQPGWRFISKQISVASTAAASFRVDD